MVLHAPEILDADESALTYMKRFAARTHVTGTVSHRRYLWTDAFGVCTFLGLGKQDLALALIDRVHHELGRHRRDDERNGWLSGASELDGEMHPTRGGLRIGKPLPERLPSESYDADAEWDRDGQYFHYLTQWMHALAQTARATDEPTFELWARELAETAHRAFVVDSVPRRMIWKASIDLTRPLVGAMGQHDALDGYVTFRELLAVARDLRTAARGPQLEPLIATLHAMIDPDALATTDPLGIGGLLVDAYRLQQLGGDAQLGAAVTNAAFTGLRQFALGTELHQPAERRLAFRELGLAVGLAAAPVVDKLRFAPFASVRERILAFWSDPVRRRARTWLAHEDMNEVMLAAALAPRGYLVL